MENNYYFDVETDLVNKYPKKSVFFLHGIFGVGKSYSVKKYAFKRFFEHNERFLFVRNDSIDLAEDKSKFIDDISKEFPDKDLENKFKWKTDKNVVFGYYEKESNVVCRLVYLTSLRKAGRDEKVKTMIFDEYNMLNTRAYNAQWPSFKLLLSRFENINKYFFIGNAVTENVPILYHMDIKNLDFTKKEINIDDDIIVYNINKRIKTVEDKYKDKIFFKLLKRDESAISHMFLNKSKDDKLDLVDFTENQLKEVGKLWVSFKINEDLYVDSYLIPGDMLEDGKPIFFIIENKDAKNGYALNKKYSNSNWKLDRLNFKKKFMGYYINGQVKFLDQYVKDLFIETIKKWGG